MGNYIDTNINIGWVDHIIFVFAILILVQFIIIKSKVF